jgi:hypothetical protein
MNKLLRVRDVLLGIALAVAGIAALPLIPFVALAKGPYVRWERTATGRLVSRYELPRWLAWFGTPDELLPGALYEARVVASLDSWGGVYWTTVKWLSANRLYGLTWAFGRPVSDYMMITDSDGYVVQFDLISGFDDLWRWKKTTGPLVWLAGWKVHRASWRSDSGLIAIPFVSVRLAGNG